jgi:hypothetical protein
MEKKVLTPMFIAIILLSLSLVSAMNLEVTTNPVSDAAITDFNEPAVFDMFIKNNEGTDYFEIYSLVGVEMYPKEPFAIASMENKKLQLKVMPFDSLKSEKGYFVFEYNIKNSAGKIQTEKLTINIVDLKDAVGVNPDSINPKSEKIELTIKNLVMYDLGEVNVKMTAPFFESEQTLDLKQFASEHFSIPINKEKLKTLEAGNYLIKTEIKAKGKTVFKEVLVEYTEEENIKTTESVSGFIIRDYEIDKQNQGNVKRTISINAEKNLVSYLFTTFNNKPSETRISGFAVNYYWEQDMAPGDELNVTITTNWLYPLLILILIIVIIWFIIKYIEEDVSLRKNVSYIKTKGGEFALRVTLRIKSKKALSNIKITDHLPHLVNLYEKYGAISPDKVDMKSRMLEWNLSSLESGEEKIFSYIVYSKVGVFGKFELPHARASYELHGKTKHMFSNKAAYVNESK